MELENSKEHEYKDSELVEVEDEEDEEDNVINLRIQNVVATLSLNTRVDLDKIASTARNAEYNPRR
jgi:hypothetical protein